MSLLKIYLILLIVTNLAHAKPMGIERVNFFPDSDAYLVLGYKHARLKIETDKQLIQTKEVNNHSNLMRVEYAHRFARKLFIGVGGSFEQASENAAIHSVPLNRRYISSGFNNPEAFGIYRLRHQKADKGNIDLLFSYSPTLGPREISKESSTRSAGRNIFNLAFANGFQEDQWEFRSRLSGTYFSLGEERNGFLDTTFMIERTYQVEYTFTTQYSLKDSWNIGGSIGIIYLASEITDDQKYEKRELRSGTESAFQGFVKWSLSDWSLLEASYSLRRRDYFIKAETFNLDGRLTYSEYSLNYVVLF